MLAHKLFPSILMTGAVRLVHSTSQYVTLSVEFHAVMHKSCSVPQELSCNPSKGGVFLIFFLNKTLALGLKN